MILFNVPRNNYLASIKKLTDDLGISRYFDNSFMERFNRNLEHKDSLINMTNNVFSLTDKYLRSNDQLKTSVFILTGSWIESIYISSTLVKDVPKSESNAAVYTRLFNQRLHLKQLLDAMEPFKDDEYFKKIIPALNEVLSVSMQPASEVEFSQELIKTMADKIQKLHSELY